MGTPKHDSGLLRGYRATGFGGPRRGKDRRECVERAADGYKSFYWSELDAGYPGLHDRCCSRPSPPQASSLR